MNKLKKYRNKKGIGFVDSGVKILIAVVIGALTLGGFYALAKDNVLLTAKSKIESLFDYSQTNELEIQAPIKGDFNNDGIIDNADKDILTAEILSQSGNYEFSDLDLNDDGVIDLLDLMRLKSLAIKQSQQS